MRKFTLNDGRIRFGWMCMLLLAVFAGVIVRLGWLQIVRADDLRKQSENQLTADLTQKHPRRRGAGGEHYDGLPLCGPRGHER